MGLGIGNFVYDCYERYSRSFFRLLGRSGREDVNLIREEILVSKQQLLSQDTEGNLYDDDIIDEESLQHITNPEVLRNYHILQNGSQELDAKLQEDSPEAYALDRNSVVQKCTFVKQFIYENVFHKYIVLPGLLMALGVGVNTFLKNSSFSPEICKGLFSATGLLSYEQYIEKKKGRDSGEWGKNLLLSSLLSYGVGACVLGNRCGGYVPRLVFPILAAFGTCYRQTLKDIALGKGPLNNYLGDTHRTVRKQEVEAIKGFSASLLRSEQLDKDLKSCVEELIYEEKFDRLLPFVAKELVYESLSPRYFNRVIPIIYAITNQEKAPQLAKNLFINKGHEYLHKQLNLKSFDKNIERRLINAAINGNKNAINLFKEILIDKLKVFFNLVKPTDIVNLVFKSLHNQSDGISPSSAGIKLFNKFNDKFFHPDIQNLVVGLQLGRDMSDDDLQMVYDKINMGRDVFIDKKSFEYIWKHALFPHFADLLYHGVAKAGIALSFLSDGEILKMSKFIQFYVKILSYDILHEIGLNSLPTFCESQVITHKDINKAASHSMNLCTLFCTPTKLASCVKVAKEVSSLLFIPTHENEPELRLPPSHHGIGSYYPGATDIGSVISYSNPPNTKDAIPVVRGMIDESPPHMMQWREVTESSDIQMVPTVHCANTSDWRKKLIRSAEHNIVISGNYCGQKAFDEILELIEERMEENKDLKVVIISSPNFVKNDERKGVRNQILIDALKMRYPQRFSIVYSADVWLIGGKDIYKKSTNHTKYLGIDWGRYYIMGGSAIKDNFNMSGVDNIFDVFSDEEINLFRNFQEGLADLRQRWQQRDPDLTDLRESCQNCISLGEQLKTTVVESSHYSREELSPAIDQISNIVELIGEALEQDNIVEFCHLNANHLHLTEQNDNDNSVMDGGLLGMLVPGNFRDMDFVFSDPNDGFSSGRQLFLEMIRMAYRWEALDISHKRVEGVTSFSPSEVAELPIFRGTSKEECTDTDTVTHRIMKEPMPPKSQLNTRRINGFENVDKGNLQVIYQGPEQASGSNEFASHTLDLIRNAKERIVFNHMYFCPTDEILEALKEAIEERGVQVEIITCGDTENCPNSQKAFGPYNKMNWSKLANKIDSEHRHNLKVFLYLQRKKGLHKKVIVFDDNIVLAGSSNFGYKSLVTSSDHEVNFIGKCNQFARKTLDVCEEDKKLSVQIEDTTQISSQEYMRALFYHQSRSLAN